MFLLHIYILSTAATWSGTVSLNWRWSAASGVSETGNAAFKGSGHGWMGWNKFFQVMTVTGIASWWIIWTDHKDFAGFSTVKTKIFKNRHGYTPCLIEVYKKGKRGLFPMDTSPRYLSWIDYSEDFSSSAILRLIISRLFFTEFASAFNMFSSSSGLCAYAG